MLKVGKKSLVSSLVLLTLSVSACTSKFDVSAPITGGNISEAGINSKLKGIIESTDKTNGTFKLKGDGEVLTPKDPSMVEAIKSGEITEGAEMIITDSSDIEIKSNGKLFNFKRVSITNSKGISIS